MMSSHGGAVLLNQPRVTVFTPTFNRRHLLQHAYEGLTKQTTKSFEWLIVDDGSTDGTEKFVEQMKANAPFPIRYYFQKNQGKHIAANKGIALARGELFLFLDSDDTCKPSAIETFIFQWESIPPLERATFSTIMALCGDRFGHVSGKPFPEYRRAALDFWEQYRLRRGGERFGINRTEVLREFQFPSFAGETFMPEGIVWNRIASKYKALLINEILREYEPQPDSLSHSAVGIRVRSPRGAALYYSELSDYTVPYWVRLGALLNWVRFTLHGGNPLKKCLTSGRSLEVLCLLPAAWLMYWSDRWRD
jgi:glycosyltransferase involved in cell wall biosynthesis